MNTLKCKCGADITESTKFCGSCGAKTEPVAAVPEPVVAPAAEVPVAPPPAEVPVAPAPVAPPPAEVPVAPAPVAPPPAPVMQAPPPVTPEAPAYAAAGAPAVSAETESKKILGMELKKFAMVAGAAVLGVILLIVLFSALSPGQYQTVKGSVFAVPIDYETSMVFPSGKAGVKIDGSIWDIEISLDGTKAAILVRDEDSIDGYTLYFIGSKVDRIDGDVRDFWFAPNGGGIAYTKYYDDDDAGELFLWNGKDTRKISNDFALDSGWWGWSLEPAYDCVISPGGKTVGFVAEKSNDRHIGIIWSNGKETELGTDFIPVAVSNGAKYIYYERNDTLNVQRGFNENTRQRLGSSAYIVAFNNDMSQIVYNTYGSSARSFISNKGKDGISLSGTVDQFIFPANTREFDLSYGTIYGVSSFVNTFYHNGSIIRIKNGRFETDRVMGSVGYATLASDGKTLTYLRNRGIFKVNGTASNPNPVELVGDDVWAFIATDNGSAIFFIDNHNDINFQKGTGRAANVAYSFSWDGLALYNGNTLFYIQDRELYSSVGRSGTKISGLNADIYEVYADTTAIYAIGRDGSDTIVYRSTNGRKFTEVK